MISLADIGSRLLRLRKERNLKQNEVAIQIGLSSVNLSRYEKGNRTPDQKTLYKLAKFYNVKPSYLLFGEEENKHDFLNYITEEEAKLLKEYLKEIRNNNNKE